MSDIPEVKRYERGDRLPVQAQRIWLILVAFVMMSRYQHRGPRKSLTLTYGDVASLMRYPDKRAGHMLSRQLGIIGEYCKMNDLPALNAIVVNESTGMPGDEVVLRKGRTVKQEQSAIWGEDWFALRVPTTATLRKVWEATS